jgi:hypothetical protein
VRGHLWTIGRHAVDAVAPPVVPPSRAWRGVARDPELGDLTLSGRWASPPGAAAAIVVVHGLGGQADSAYVQRFAARAHARGFATLRLNLRGADRRGGDFYHAGLTDDLVVALAAPELADVGRIYLVGYSLGGHVALRHAVASPGRLRAVATICSPLDLAASCAALERPGATLYRLHLLRGLRAMYAAVAATRAVTVPPEALRWITSIYEWDGRVVAPRWGFAGADDYYRRASVAGELGKLDVPTLYLGVEADPMVSHASVMPALRGASPALTTRWLRDGGHVGFPRAARVEDEVLDFLSRH